MVKEVEVYNRSFDVHSLVPESSDQAIFSLAERLLFPPDNTECSGGEDEDWIVSDGEDDFFDVKEMLRSTEDGEGKILYHTEVKKDVESETFVLDDLKPRGTASPLPLHEAVCGEEDDGGGGEALKKALELYNEPGLLDITNSQGPSYVGCRYCFVVPFFFSK